MATEAPGLEKGPGSSLPVCQAYHRRSTMRRHDQDVQGPEISHDTGHHRAIRRQRRNFDVNETTRPTPGRGPGHSPGNRPGGTNGLEPLWNLVLLIFALRTAGRPSRPREARGRRGCGLPSRATGQHRCRRSAVHRRARTNRRHQGPRASRSGHRLDLGRRLRPPELPHRLRVTWRRQLRCVRLRIPPHQRVSLRPRRPRKRHRTARGTRAQAKPHHSGRRLLPRRIRSRPRARGRLWWTLILLLPLLASPWATNTSTTWPSSTCSSATTHAHGAMRYWCCCPGAMTLSPSSPLRQSSTPTTPCDAPWPVNPLTWPPPHQLTQGRGDGGMLPTHQSRTAPGLVGA